MSSKPGGGPPASPFPETFRFGVGNSDHQCESFDPDALDVWDAWEKRRNLVPRGLATQFDTRFPEDIALARGLGVQLFRFSVSWARVEPRPFEYDAAVLARYRAMLDAIVAAGLQPMITLHHFVWPMHVEERGGMRAAQFPDWFRRYADAVAEALGPAARDWISFNEPNLLAFGVVRPWWQREYSFPPGLPLDQGGGAQLRALAQLIANLFRAHSLARAAIRAHIPGARVGANPSVLGLPGIIRRFIDARLTRARNLDELIQSQRQNRPRWWRMRTLTAVMAGFTITRERGEDVDFTSPYLTAGQGVLLGPRLAASGADAPSGTIGVIAGSTAAQRVGSLLPHWTAVTFRSPEGLRDAVTSGGVDAALADDVMLLGWQNAAPGRLRLLPGRLTRESYGIATSRGSVMLDALEAALASFRRSGALDAAITRNLPGYVPAADAKGTPRDTLADAQDPRGPDAQYDPAFWRACVAPLVGRRPIRIAVSANVPGLGLYDKASGTWTGLEVEIARYVAEFLTGKTGRLELVAVSVKERINLFGGLLLRIQRLFEPITMLFSVICTNWWHLGMAGRLPEFLCPPECVGQQDFVGFDYYWGVSGLRPSRIRGLIKALTAGDFSEAPIWVGGLGEALRYHHELHPDLPIYVVENGSIGEVESVDRGHYLREHIAEAQRAVAAGIPLDTFVMWSITTNREWNAREIAGSDFGLYSIDLDNDPALVRHETPSAIALRAMMAARSAC